MKQQETKPVGALYLHDVYPQVLLLNLTTVDIAIIAYTHVPYRNRLRKRMVVFTSA